MGDGGPGIIQEQVLFGNVSDIRGFGIFGEEMVKWLVFSRANMFRYRLPPFFGIRELRVHIKNDASERVVSMLNHLADMKFGIYYACHRIMSPFSVKTVETTIPIVRCVHQ